MWVCASARVFVRDVQLIPNHLLVVSLHRQIWSFRSVPFHFLHFCQFTLRTKGSPIHIQCTYFCCRLLCSANPHGNYHPNLNADVNAHSIEINECIFTYFFLYSNHSPSVCVCRLEIVLCLGHNHHFHLCLSHSSSIYWCYENDHHLQMKFNPYSNFTHLHYISIIKHLNALVWTEYMLSRMKYQ